MTSAVSQAVSYELISHACILFNFNGFRVLTDPWLLGSCYYRSWWHYPKPARTLEELTDVDLIVISHEHPDHFHTASLKKFPKHIPVWIPQYFFTGFRDRLKALGFTSIHEMRHGKAYTLPNGLALTAHLYRADDAVVALDFKDQSWLHFNDCLIAGKALRRLAAAHPNVHTMFKIFANAEAYPYCYESEDPSELKNWDNHVIVDSFLSTAALLKARYAVPYAGFIRIFHREGSEVNSLFTPPESAVERALQTGFKSSEVHALPPGGGWSSAGGWKTEGSTQSFEAREAELAPRMAEVYADEKPVPEVFEKCSRYFQKYLRRLPFFFRNRLKLKVLFLPSDLNGAFLLEPAAGKMRRASADEDADVRVCLSSALLNKAVTERSWLIALGSYRARIKLKAGVRETEAFFWMTVFLFDAGYFSFEKFNWFRVAGVLWDRREEFRDYVAQFLKGDFVRINLQKKYEGAA